MNQLLNISEQKATLTMSSREIASLINKNHSDLCRSIERLMVKGVIRGYQPMAYTHPQEHGHNYTQMPELDRELCYIRGILKNRMYVNFGYVMQLMKKATSLGFDVEDLKELAKTAKNWTSFKNTLEEFIQEGENEF